MSEDDHLDSAMPSEREDDATANKRQWDFRGSALVFPYLYGPAIRRFGTSLLWHGRLCCSSGSFATPYPLRRFTEVWAASAGTSLEQLFATVAHYTRLGMNQALSEMDNLADLKDLIGHFPIVGPGTTQAYEAWEPYHPTCLNQAASMLQDTQTVTVAANEFVWRVYELSLETGAQADRPSCNPMPIVQSLAERAAWLGSPEALLAECLLNCHRVLESGAMPLVTDQASVIGIYASVGKAVFAESEGQEANQHVLAFMLFDALLREHIPPLERPHTERVAKMLQVRADELKGARAKCLEEAAGLLDEKPTGERLHRAIEVSLRKLDEELSAVLEIDRTAFKELVRSTTENKDLWITLAGIVGGLLGSIPDFAAAAAAVTAFSILGTSALKQARARRDVLRKSPWAFVYFLQR